MKKSASISLLLLVFVGCHAQTPQAEVDKVIAAMIKPESGGVTVAVAKEGEILFNKGYGLANVEYNVPNSPKTIFHVASLSKQVTAFAIAMLADEKKISLDDDIRKYLPELHDFGTKITIKHLVHHTSGLRDQWNLLALAGWRLDDVITKNQVMRLISHQDELNFKPGDEFSYCNTGYTLMGEIVSRVTGKSFADWCSENIFKPLAMDRTFFYDDHEKIVKGRAYSYNESPQGLKKSVLSYANAGATSLFTTAEDLTKWSDNFYKMKVGNKAVMKQMEERGILNKGDTISYAFGQDISRYKGVKTVAHSGGDAGYRTYLLRFPEQRYSIVVLSNLGSFNTPSLAYKIADIYLKQFLTEESKPTQDKPAAPGSAGSVTVKESVLKLYEGQYQLNSDMMVSIKLDNGKLTAQATGQPVIALTAASETEFIVEGYGIKIAFKQSDKPASEFTLYQGGQTMVAPKVKPFDPKSIDIKSYAGTYYSPELQTRYDIVLKNDTLIVNHIRHEPIPMTAIAKDAFTTNAWFMSKIDFNRNAQSEIIGFKASSGRVKNVKFVKSLTSGPPGN
jgi:CubicO group peptidase (beta-lactamase class C family)